MLRFFSVWLRHNTPKSCSARSAGSSDVMSKSMIRVFTFLLAIMCSGLSQADGLCVFTSQEKEYFEFTESYPFSDKDFSEKEATEAALRLESYSKGNTPPYFIKKNSENIVIGGELLKAFLLAEEQFKSYTPDAGNKFDRKAHDLELSYLTSRKKYCDFRRSNYAIDW